MLIVNHILRSPQAQPVEEKRPIIGPSRGLVGAVDPSGDGLTEGAARSAAITTWHLCEDDSTPTGHWVRGTTADTTVPAALPEQPTPLNKKALR